MGESDPEGQGQEVVVDGGQNAFRPRPVRVPSDDYRLVGDDGEEYWPHRGEWVEVVRGRESIVGLRALLTFTQESRLSNESLMATFADLCASIAARVVAWNWTSPAGHPLPQPDGTAERLAALTASEVYYLREVCLGEAPAERKNGSDG